MEEPPYDLVILGATGFTGKYVVREALKFLNISPLKSLALAGRNLTKLNESLKWAAHPLPPPPIPLLLADVTDPHSIRRLCSYTKLILNCVGPFRRYGKAVVEACVETGCDYLDICGEPEFMERMEAEYDKMAVEKGSLVVSGCGFDSVPAELAVLGVANAGELRQFRRSRPPRRSPLIVGRSTPKGPLLEYKKQFGVWSVRIPSADSSVIRRTLFTLAENPQGLLGSNETLDDIEQRKKFWSSVKPARFGVKIGMKSFLGILRFIVFGIFIGMLAKKAFGRWLLLTFPSIFSLGLLNKKSPSEDEVNNVSFKMWFVGHGFDDNGNDKEIVTRIMGPEPGYITTSIILIQCAFILLTKRQVLPKGGVLTPGIVFGPTHLQQKLQDNGISFDVISNN
ncbi:hypothetical protein Csa_000763 [Cucumis sativus]|nr:hypothetical protein Csa_000763 [Cucumis sativus]